MPKSFGLGAINESISVEEGKRGLWGRYNRKINIQ
jgi:hypothetical protein